MKDKYLISYNLFCQRKKFSLENFLARNIEMSEDEILNYFRKNSVEPPSVLQIRTLRDKIKLEKQKLAIDESKEKFVIEKKVEKDLPVESVQKKESLKKKTRRRKKKDA